MGKAIWTSGILTLGRSLLGRWGAGRASVKQAVHDGDTVTVEADGNISVRFLGIDTPEISFTHPDTNTFMNIDPNFVNYLTDPFSNVQPDSKNYINALGNGLVTYLRKKLGPDCATNHSYHADQAHRKLEDLIQRDVNTIIVGPNQKPEDLFRFFMAFAYEIMDGYGRFLCFLHQDLPKSQRKGRISYNEELLTLGLAEPYLIFPNINPFRKVGDITSAVPSQKNFNTFIQDPKLQQARNYVKIARLNQIGIFDKNNPLMLEPFELRFLARRKPPSRWVIDMTAHKPVLIKPTDYYKIPNPEDRLFVNLEHVPLFKDKGY